MDCLKTTKDKHLILRLKDGVSVAKWYIDASFATYNDFQSHTVGILKIGDDGGAITNASIKQKINTQSSTEADLMGVDDLIGKVLWTSRFLESQGSAPKRNIILQDNQSSIFLETKGSASAGKGMCNMNVHYCKRFG